MGLYKGSLEFPEEWHHIPVYKRKKEGTIAPGQNYTMGNGAQWVHHIPSVFKGAQTLL